MKIEIPLVIDYIFKRTLGKARFFNTYAPGIEVIENSDLLIKQFLADEVRQQTGSGATKVFLDVGAEDSRRIEYAAGFDYVAIDIHPTSDNVLKADICCCPELESEAYDVVFSLDVLEHVKKPWEAAKECLRLTKPGGLMVHRTVFSYRYHPQPIDYWRFSSQCLENLFTESGQAITLAKGYDLRGRRRNRMGYGLDTRPPIDWMGGFRENWQVLWIGRKSN